MYGHGFTAIVTVNLTLIIFSGERLTQGVGPRRRSSEGEGQGEPRPQAVDQRPEGAGVQEALEHILQRGLHGGPVARRRGWVGGWVGNQGGGWLKAGRWVGW